MAQEIKVENKLLKTNDVRIVGTLINADIREGVSKSGTGYVSANATVVANLDGADHEFIVRFFSNTITKEGAPNKNAEKYSNLSSMIGKRVTISGSLEENRYWSDEQLKSAISISGRFIGEDSSNKDMASFEIGGFLISDLMERTNKNGDLIVHELKIAQSNYKGDGLSLITLHVHKANMEVSQAIPTLYQLGDTVQFRGQLSSLIEERTVTSEDNAFGAPQVRVFRNITRNYFIAGGNNPLEIGTDGHYSEEERTRLIAAYKARGAEIQAAAAGSPANSGAKVTNKQTSLL